MTPTDERLATLAALAREAGIGETLPYSYEGQDDAGNHRYSVCTGDHSDPKHECIAEVYSKESEAKAGERAALIAAAINAAPALLAERERLRAALEACATALETCAPAANWSRAEQALAAARAALGKE